MRIRFWGTRGSIAKAGPTTVRYGGNTSCVELRTSKGTTVVLDCGTGAHGLGTALLREPGGPQQGHILISHTHWDHIQGLPFFAPLFVPGHRWRVCGPRGLGPSISEVIAGQMDFTYFPITTQQFQADISYQDLVEGRFEIDDIVVTAQYLNHPGLTLGYRLEADGVTVVYATDHEPHLRRLAEGGEPPQGSEDERHGQFIADADLVIHDTQYTAEEYPDRVGYGHSTMEYVVDMSRAAAVQRVAMFHHDPLRDDDSLDALLGRARERVAARGGGALDVMAAAEGRTIELKAPQKRRRTRTRPIVADAEVEGAGPSGTVLLASDEGPDRERLRAAAAADRLHVLEASDLCEARWLIEAKRPDLVFLGRHIDGEDCLPLCAELRGSEEHGRMVPLVIYGDGSDIDPEAGRLAGINGWLECPFSEQYARARMRGWLLRKELRWGRAKLPSNEQERVAAVQALGLLGTEPEERFDRFTRLARSLFRVPMAWINLVDVDAHFSKSRPRGTAAECPRDVSFCAHTILGDEVHEIPDARLDARHADNPTVNGKPFLRFYAGVPLQFQGQAVGTLCIGDVQPRRLGKGQREHLRDLGGLVQEELARRP